MEKEKGHKTRTLMGMKLSPASVASAFATSVLEQPGGPYSSTPRGGLMPKLVNFSGYLIGHLGIIGMDNTLTKN
jgi:hypothetical protein